MVSAIIPAYNESAGVARAIKTLKLSPLVHEIIVVNDGSSDNTSDVALQSGARVITLPRNMGKGYAMQSGIKESLHDTILFCDGDMYGFSTHHIEEVVSPVLKGEKDMVIGVRPIISMSRYIFPFLTQISGFRAIKKSLWSEIPRKFISGYQIESAINFVARRNDWRVMYSKVPGLNHSVKEAKLGILNGLYARIKMSFDIFSFFLDLYLLRRAKSNAEIERVKLYK